MNQGLVLLCSLTLLISCQSEFPVKEAKKIKQLTEEQVIERMKAGTFTYAYARFRSQEGRELSLSQQDSLHRGLYGKDYYIDQSGSIVEVRLRPIQHEDELLETIGKALAKKPLENYTILTINCDSLDFIYREIQSKNLERWAEFSEHGDRYQLNLEIIISSLATCGWSDVHLAVICSTFQRAPRDITAFFYSNFKDLAERGKISREAFEAIEKNILPSTSNRRSQTHPGLLSSPTFQKDSLLLKAINSELKQLNPDSLRFYMNNRHAKIDSIIKEVERSYYARQ